MKIFFLHKCSFCVGILLLSFSLSGTSFPQTFLNPNNFSSLGTFSSSNSIAINMSTGQMSGGASFTGVVSGGVLVFTFANFTLNSGHTITFTNVSDLGSKVAFLSQGDMTISGAINANASGRTSPGPGGGYGGEAGGGAPGSGNSGSGSGGGTGNENGAGGGGFGGDGGTSGLGAAGGTNYNSNFSLGISGGSGGAGSTYGINVNHGGSGGGGIELGATGTLILNSTANISVIGANGVTSTTGGNDGGGGGSGGGIFIHSFNVSLANGCTLNVSGGNGGAVTGALDFGCGGGGGGGGRIYIAAHTSGTLVNSGAVINVSGGLGGIDNGGSGGNGVNGNNGSSTITQLNNNALPVELNSFSAVKKGNSVELKWSTATEINNYGFEVERLQGNNWHKIGFVQGSGNSNSVKSYSYTDNSKLSSGSYSYRLKQIDNDGQFEYSNAVEILFTAPAEYSLNQNYPNPFNPVTNISYSLAEKSQVNLTVYDVLGREVVNLVNREQESGVYDVQFDAGTLNSGIYFYELKAGKYSEVKKLLLVK